MDHDSSSSEEIEDEETFQEAGRAQAKALTQKFDTRRDRAEILLDKLVMPRITERSEEQLSSRPDTKIDYKKFAKMSTKKTT